MIGALRRCIVLLLAASIVTGCLCSRDDGKGDGGSGGGGAPAASTGSSTTVASAIALRRLTPEQLSNHIYNATGYRFERSGPYGQTFDLIVDYFAVPLGGVDFDSAMTRDASVRVQTLLVARALAWASALAVVNQEARGRVPATVFTKCDLRRDRPDASAASAAAWNEQLTTTFWRFLARAPTSSEVDAIAATFVSVADRESSAANGWVAVLYAMMSTAEFWNI